MVPPPYDTITFANKYEKEKTFLEVYKSVWIRDI